MTKVRWIVHSKRANQAIIITPRSEAGVEDAVSDLEWLLSNFGAVAPKWFRALYRLGYWWYLVCIVVLIAVMVAFAPNSVAMNVAYGLGFGVGAAALSGWILYSLARLQARVRDGRSYDQTLKELGRLARPAGSVEPQVDAILSRDPMLESEVHDLAWRAAGFGTANRKAAELELHDLWRMADPWSAEQREAKLRELEKQARLDER